MFINYFTWNMSEGMVGDTGFEPVTSTVCKRHKKKGKQKI